MKRMTLFLKAGLPAVVLLIAGCDTGGEMEVASEPAAETSQAAAEVDIASIRQGIDATNQAAEEAIAAGDVAGFVAQTYTDDAVILPPGAPKISGHAAIEEFWNSAGEQLGLSAIQLESDEVVPAGPDMAYEIGIGTLQTAQGPMEAKYVVIWRRGEDDRWRWHVDMWNEMPASDASDG